jgi:hypothetical protein
MDRNRVRHFGFLAHRQPGDPAHHAGAVSVDLLYWLFPPITGFMWLAWIIALFIPMTYAIEGLQNLMLSGSAAGGGAWFGLGLIVLLTYGLVLLVMRRRYGKVLE